MNHAAEAQDRKWGYGGTSSEVGEPKPTMAGSCNRSPDSAQWL